MLSETPPFLFYTERRLVVLTGCQARNLGELERHLREVSGSSIFYHTHHQYLSHHFEKPTFYNDFAAWTARALQIQPLAEKLAAIDLLAFTSIRQLREAILALVERYARGEPWRTRECPPGDEFHFCLSKSFFMPTGIVARDLADFAEKLPRVSTVSLFFHFFEARLRLGQATNDFSRWLSDLGQRELANAIDRLDPYTMTLDELKEAILSLCKSYASSTE